MQRPFPNGHKYPFGCNGYVTTVAAGQSQRFYHGVGIFIWYYLSSPPQVLRPSRCPLELGGLICLHLRYSSARTADCSTHNPPVPSSSWDWEELRVDAVWHKSIKKSAASSYFYQFN